jgi:deazaflavin-dependent oxidoreductase (nitroreductase family)
MLVEMTPPASAYEYSAAGVIRRSVRLLVTSWPVAQLSPWVPPGLDRLSYRVTRGRFTFSTWATGLPVLLLSTKGARTGEPRIVRVLGIPDGDGFIIVAANFGQRANPAWHYNLRAHPRVCVVVGGIESEYHARELSGAERERGFQRALSLNPGWRRFQKWSGQRTIPVMRLDVS